ncbi:MAG: sigma-70 family RNA polymerase sigma factor [Bacteroidetes bacterium]|nr:sigma-70 family RNA polymerase sigma factor [Bacteroidota bacterium]MCH7769731.1 sigma-70 family RNA polymerase sigma factor [Bacteroidota bacterium]
MKLTKQITIRESKSIDQYFLEIGNVDLLTPGEEIDLAIKIKNGDEDAQEKLVKANLRFVVSVAKHFQNQGLSLGDLISEGNIGLIKAAQRFDETRGFKFISYAVWWVRQGIMQAIADQSRVVRLPLNRVSNLTKISKAFRDLEQEFERKPTTEELAKILDMTTDEVAYALQISGRHISMDAPLKAGDENKNSLMDVLPNEHQPLPDKDLMNESLKNELANALSILSKREAEVIKLAFGIGAGNKATLEEIGERFNLTRERIRQIKEKALRKLRGSKRSDRLITYL